MEAKGEGAVGIAHIPKHHTENMDFILKAKGNHLMISL